ncbi:Gpi16 subunit, GPI transamidase component domain containing protein [Lactarius tabidus]
MNGFLPAHFSFSTSLPGAVPRNTSSLGTYDSSSFRARHCMLFPLARGKILREREPANPDSGAELFVMRSTSIDARWQVLQNALTGLFYASLGSMDALHTTLHTNAFLPASDLPRLPAPHTHPPPRDAPRRARSLASTAALLEPNRSFDGDWHGLGVHVRWRPDAGVELTLAVLDPVRLFERTVPRSCNVAFPSNVRVALPPEEAEYMLSPETVVFTEAGVVADEEGNFSYSLEIPPQSYLSVRRTLKDTSQTHAELSVAVCNNRPVPVRTHYVGTGLLTNMTYTPSRPDAPPALLLGMLEFPPHETPGLPLRVCKTSLRYTEHPPNAQRGWYRPPAVFVPFDDLHSRIYTPALLVDLVVLDFSMPYNVIIMYSSSSVVWVGEFTDLAAKPIVCSAVSNLSEYYYVKFSFMTKF